MGKYQSDMRRYGTELESLGAFADTVKDKSTVSFLIVRLLFAMFELLYNK